MAILTKCIYGYETDSKKTPFNLLNNQVRIDSVINNAGWFNALGERLGCGDLSLKDMHNISKRIPGNEMFVVLTELDASWDIPSELDRSSPGFDYIMQNASWIIANTPAGIGLILKICGNEFPVEDVLKNGVKYIKIPRKDFYAAINYKTLNDKKELSVKKSAPRRPATKSVTNKPTPVANKPVSASSTVQPKPIPLKASQVTGVLPKAIVKSATKKVGGFITASPQKP